MNHDIYLDANATSPVLPEALAAAVEAMQANYGNPSSSHATGLRAKAILDATRARARRVLGAGPGRLLFTSGATEGIHTAVLSALCAVRERRAAGDVCGDLLLYGATEHKAVPESLAHWNRLLGTGLTLRAVPVDADGRHRMDVLRELAPRAAMLCTMAANNETGVVSDLDAIARVLKDLGSRAYWLVDCVQALGKLPLHLADTRIDYAPFSGHKLYAPKGIGMLYVRDGAPYTPLITGGGQEDGQRSGTENMAGIAALGAVLKALEDGATFRNHDQLAAMRARVVHALREAFPGIVFNARFETTLPTTINFAVPGLPARELLDLFDAAGMRVSAGSACSAAKAAPSYVLEAMGVPDWQASGAVRLSFGPLADEAFIDAACARIRRCGQAMRGMPLASNAAPAGQAGVARFSSDGRHGWLVLDHEAGECVAIDPPPALAGRMADAIRRHGLRLVAALATHADAEGAEARAALRVALGMDGADPGPLGWPAHVADDAANDALVVGRQRLRRLPGIGADHAMYLLDAPRLVFAGDLAGHAFGAGAVPADAILCHRADVDGAAWTRPGAAVMDEARQLQQDALERFLRTHGDALVVDVREAFEAEAGALHLLGRETRNLPLSRLAEHLEHLLAAPQRPLVFICRSGNRSARAALCLQRLGHPHAWTVVGGIALVG
ncbi:aminotransferase class V-fold PLP-dependent enzyme [Massilia sp. 9096]|uniref:aminotransferase class V-fold PLP-dependent enzyme n=1 Tax=Massilia sp. 9096 TaxID=1500894 RepID=UPI00055BB44D|nr:aminotransferase class V-fold PLP-dependent enzyme [Massilia sp. 9096]